MSYIEVIDFHKGFGKRLIHKGVSFSLEKGECLGLLGGSGAGKSLILRALIGLEKADSGKIFIDGEDVARHSEEELIPIRKKVAYAFQGGALFDSMTVYENLAYPLREHTDLKEKDIADKIAATLKEFGLSGTESLLPASLSGGMQKRVGLARAIILDPDIILYDEPTAGLDPFNTIRIQETILQLKTKGVTSILVTHDMPSAFAVCDRLAVLENGKIAASGKLADLDTQKGGVIYRFIHGEIKQDGYNR
jgi:phospholipid/cholesterol/gamma-HCH transport system ATP-binding protein